MFSLYSHTGAVNSVDFSFAGDYFATGGDDKNLQLWKTNVYESQTREADLIQPKTKFVNDKIVKFAQKVEAVEEFNIPTANLQSSKKPNQHYSGGIGSEQMQSMTDSQVNNRPIKSDEQIIEVKADEKISANLDRIMNQMDKLYVMLKVSLSMMIRIWRLE